jgi:hypothetical protein
VSCRRGAVETLGLVLDDLLLPFLLIKLVSPPFINWPVSLTLKF